MPVVIADVGSDGQAHARDRTPWPAAGGQGAATPATERPCMHITAAPPEGVMGGQRACENASGAKVRSTRKHTPARHACARSRGGGWARATQEFGLRYNAACAKNCAAHARAWAIVKGAGISPACALLPAAEHPANGREGAAARPWPPRRRALPWCRIFNPLHPCLRVRVWERGACVWGGCRHAGAIAITHMLNAYVRCTRSVWCTPKVWCTPNVWSTWIITSGTCYFYLSCLVAVAVCVCAGIRG